MYNSPVNIPQTVTMLDLGIGTEHELHTMVARPQGLDDMWLLMCFSTPFWFRSTGEILYGAPGDCVIHAPSEPHWHGAVVGSAAGFCNDWIHMRGPGVAAAIRDCGLETSVLLPTLDRQTLTPFLQRIRREMYRRDVQWETMVRIEIEEMFVKIARCLSAAAWDADTLLERAMRERLTDLRVRVHDTLERVWTVEEMAAEAYLSPSRFHALYKRFFQVSPMDDLIQRRIAHAQWLLSSTSISIGEAGRRSGFSSPYYFSRAFRRRTGVSPSDYARDRP